MYTAILNVGYEEPIQSFINKDDAISRSRLVLEGYEFDEYESSVKVEVRDEKGIKVWEDYKENLDY